MENRIALALRSPLYRGEEILDFVQLAEGSEQVSHLFFPEIWASHDSIELSAAAFGVTRRIRVGSGVLRPLEYRVDELVRRLGTLQFLSKNRFILGIGTGNPGPNPRETIHRMLTMLEETKGAFAERHRDKGLTMPEVVIAALRPGIAKRAIDHADGLLLNFCSPQYAGRLVQSLQLTEGKAKTMACYIKIFYSRNEQAAKKMLIDEFVNYDRSPSYHAMFARAGVSDDIVAASKEMSVAGSFEIPKSLLDISLFNPTRTELQDLVSRFREAGVNLPCIYPYFALDEEPSFKLDIARQITGIK